MLIEVLPEYMFLQVLYLEDPVRARRRGLKAF